MDYNIKQVDKIIRDRNLGINITHIEHNFKLNKGEKADEKTRIYGEISHFRRKF